MGLQPIPKITKTCMRSQSWGCEIENTRTTLERHWKIEDTEKFF